MNMASLYIKLFLYLNLLSELRLSKANMIGARVVTESYAITD